MKAAQERVRRFHEAMATIGARGDVGNMASPGTPHHDSAMLRAVLVIEECVELVESLVGTYCTEQLFEVLPGRIADRKSKLPSVTDSAHELADLLVVTLGTAVAAGIDIAPVFHEVMSANERKVGPGARVREDGKLLKPGGWVGPDVEAVLQRQRKEYGQ